MFKIYIGNTVVGQAEVKKNGLYYHITCTCNPPSNDLYRIIMTNKDVKKDLGVCVPKGEYFSLFTRVPVKLFEDGSFRFHLVNGRKGEYIVSDNTPFAHLDKLETARLQHANGQSMIIVDTALNQQDNGQIQEHPNK